MPGYGLTASFTHPSLKIVVDIFISKLVIFHPLMLGVEDIQYSPGAAQKLLGLVVA